MPAGILLLLHPVKKRILLVDDDAAVRDSLCRALATEDYAVNAVASGMEALATLDHQNADVVLLDLNMPGMDGWQVLKKIQSQEPRLPVILITAQAHQTATVAAAGARALCEKPIDLPYLLAMIKTLGSAQK